MRSLGAAVMLGGVALMGVLLLVFSGGEASTAAETVAWTGRSLLALAPIRPQKSRGSHRHGKVEYRYQNVDCDSGVSTTTTTTTVTTTTEAPATTTTEATNTTTMIDTTTETTLTESTTSTESTTTSPCVTCPPTTDLCNPWVCIRDDQQEFRCVQIPVECNDGNDCTSDKCVNGTCMYTLEPERPGCNCTTKDCMSTPCDPMFCVETATGPECMGIPPVCNDQNNCTDDTCMETIDGGVNCTFTYNSSLPGCENLPGGGLSGGAIAGIAIAAVAAVAIAALIAFWARKNPNAGAGTASAATTAAAQTSPLYSDPVNAGVMPAM